MRVGSISNVLEACPRQLVAEYLRMYVEAEFEPFSQKTPKLPAFYCRAITSTAFVW